MVVYPPRGDGAGAGQWDGLVYLHARYYDPATGQFLTPDTLVPEPADVLSYNRYLYAYGNPLRFTDPTGHYSDDEIMQHFGCPDWACVEAYFDANGALAGLWGWLHTLRGAEDGHAVEILTSVGHGADIAYTAVAGVFQTVGDFIHVVGVQAQIDLYGSGGSIQFSWDRLNATGFGALAYLNSNGETPSGFYNDRSGGNGITMLQERPLDCQHHDCVTQTLDAMATGASGLALACGVAGVAPCVGVAQAAGWTLTGASTIWTGYNVWKGNATAADVAVFGTTTTFGLKGGAKVSLGANLAQWAWDAYRRE